MKTVTFDVVTSRPMAIYGLPNVRTHSAIDDTALASLYRTADVLFLPLVQSTANTALLEGIASGLPVVATDLEALRAYLPSGEGILVDGNRLHGFIVPLTRLAGDVDARLKMGLCARTRAEALAWPHRVRQYETLYRETLARRRIAGESLQRGGYNAVRRYATPGAGARRTGIRGVAYGPLKLALGRPTSSIGVIDRKGRRVRLCHPWTPPFGKGFMSVRAIRLGAAILERTAPFSWLPNDRKISGDRNGGGG